MNSIARFGMLTLVSGNRNQAPYVHFSLQRSEHKLGVVWVNPQGDNPNGPEEITFHSPKLAYLEEYLPGLLRAESPQIASPSSEPDEAVDRIYKP